MIITAALLQSRVKELNALRSDLLDRVLRIEGAIDDCTDLIAVLSKPEEGGEIPPSEPLP